ncbi:MAG: helix-turn-helix transcriptional regulator [Lentisphaerae bacterium]|jgi:DNA-binding XRE family transcriptional regulator|nr:helix-turn-helix transcriptional regulator [Lentisphaerota bacterium]
MSRIQNIDKELEKEVKYFAQHLETLHDQQSAAREKILTDPTNAEFLKECRERRAVAEALYRARTAANLTQAEVADRMKVSQPYIVKLEQGKGSISWRTISRYAAACGKKAEITLL